MIPTKVAKVDINVGYERPGRVYKDDNVLMLHAFMDKVEEGYRLSGNIGLYHYTDTNEINIVGHMLPMSLDRFIMLSGRQLRYLIPLGRCWE